MSDLLNVLTPVILEGNIASSTIGTGISALINDVLTWLMILSPIAGGAAATYFFIRKSAADEQDGKMWQKRIHTAIICGVAGLLSSVLISIVSGYFGV